MENEGTQEGSEGKGSLGDYREEDGGMQEARIKEGRKEGEKEGRKLGEDGKRDEWEERGE